MTRTISVSVSGRYVNEAIEGNVRYRPSTQCDRIIQNRVHDGPTWNVGMKGTF